MKIKRMWEAVYANDRRKHRHRCRICEKICKVGDLVIMWRSGRSTYAAHTECVASPHPDSTEQEPWTWTDSIRSWSHTT